MRSLRMSCTARHIVGIIAGFAVFVVGCNDPRDKFGRTWYIDGVGNWGFGVIEVPAGLEKGGYKGNVANFRWSVTMMPFIDQTFRVFARAGGSRLAGEIKAYLKRFPDNEVNLIGLSAGTGVAIWATEDLESPYKVRNVVLLASSLSSTYDVRKAQKNMTGKIHVYYTRSDPILNGPARVTGTIDGRFNDSAGLVGLRGPGAGDVVNVAWSSRFRRLGWTGHSHTDCVSEPFIREVVSAQIVPAAPAQSSEAVAVGPASKDVVAAPSAVGGAHAKPSLLLSTSNGS